MKSNRESPQIRLRGEPVSRIFFKRNFLSETCVDFRSVMSLEIKLVFLASLRSVTKSSNQPLDPLFCDFNVTTGIVSAVAFEIIDTINSIYQPRLPLVRRNDVIGQNGTYSEMT